MQELVREWLESGEVDVFIGYRMFKGHPLPYVFTKEKLEDLEGLIESPARYPLEKIATEIAAKNPELKIGLLARDCNHRALNVLYQWNQLNPERIKPLTLNCCPSPVKEHVDCSYLNWESPGSKDKIMGIKNNAPLEEIEANDQHQRFEQWAYEFDKCIKCYGCRNICPVCFCKECSLEHPDLVETGDLPVEVPIFHLVRAVHMAGRCIDCGLCEEACPVDIPLRLLYRKVNNIVEGLFDYKTGSSMSQSPFSILGDTVELEPKSIKAV